MLIINFSCYLDWMAADILMDTRMLQAIQADALSKSQSIWASGLASR